MKEFKQRASGASALLTQPRLKKDKEAGVLSKTLRTNLELWYKEQLYGKKAEFNSKYTDKGTQVEEDSLRWVSRHLGWGMVLETNKDSFEDEHFTGTPDLILGDTVVDLKNSWDFTTFPLFGEYSDVDKAYYYQLQVYMHLTGKKKAKLVYILTNTPMHLIEKEVRYKCADLKNRGIGYDEEEVEKALIEFHSYDHIRNDLKVKTYDFEYNEEAIKKMQDQVDKAREYINRLDNKYGTGK